ncbi:Glutamyl-tRNA(Gln) amidotransferase subunit A [Bradyrhizobium ivorense]|uniref:Glutamyl-tRNA(Gln) amidotransferase subunit A n=1 Tax=Bradyrhizobium ivorense TaxID=2511166 RepID=A0A508TED2_9BRAD|nr:amidase [Bradyrhizobium ivorense]VIO72791.1 Glutamyl-tRNA(Gln) amidotransferase subunit A [Bradyrhizobium ivorense]
MGDLLTLDVTGAAKAILSGSLSPIDLTEHMLERILLIDPQLKAYVEVLSDEARAAARQADVEIRSGRYRGPLHGVPVAIKELYDVRGVRTRSGSKVRDDYAADADAAVVEKLREAGAVILGTTTTYEFAFGFDSPPTRNAWSIDHIPSGSTGGAAAAVAAGMCLAGIGSDSGGSIRTPAAANGIAGIKPTYGRVSKRGITVVSWSLDHPAPMGKCVRDLAILLKIMSGVDSHDPSTKDVPVPDYTKALDGDVRGVRIGLPTNYFFDDIQPAVANALNAAVKRLDKLGAIIVPIAVPGIDGIVDAWLPIALAEAAVYHQQSLRGKADLYGEDVRMLLEAGELTLATTYINAQRVRFAWIAALRETMQAIDVIITPTLPNTAMKVGETISKISSRHETVFEVSARFCAPFNMAGLPAASIPCGFAPDGLPIGLQIVGKPFDEAMVLRVGHAFENDTDYHLKRPSLRGLIG